MPGCSGLEKDRSGFLDLIEMFQQASNDHAEWRGIELVEFDYVDIGALIPSSGAVPVVIKSLVFPGSAGG